MSNFAFEEMFSTPYEYNAFLVDIKIMYNMISRDYFSEQLFKSFCIDTLRYLLKYVLICKGFDKVHIPDIEPKNIKITHCRNVKYADIIYRKKGDKWKALCIKNSLYFNKYDLCSTDECCYCKSQKYYTHGKIHEKYNKYLNGTLARLILDRTTLVDRCIIYVWKNRTLFNEKEIYSLVKDVRKYF